MVAIQALRPGVEADAEDTYEACQDFVSSACGSVFPLERQTNRDPSSRRLGSQDSTSLSSPHVLLHFMFAPSSIFSEKGALDWIGRHRRLRDGTQGTLKVARNYRRRLGGT